MAAIISSCLDKKDGMFHTRDSVVEVVHGGELLPPPLGLVEVLSDALEPRQSHLQVDHVRVGGAGVF